MAKPTVAVIDDEESARVALSRALQNYEVRAYSSVGEAKPYIAHTPPDVIILDHDMPGLSGLDYLKELTAQGVSSRVIMCTAHGSERIAVEAIKSGAYDYLVKPYEITELRHLVSNAIESVGLKRENELLRGELAQYRTGGLIGSSPEMATVFNIVAKVAHTDITVLITGESGTGKELVAQAIHEASRPRRSGEFVAMNCASLPSELIESELFGHERGAFTGAAAQRKGKFELASGGTIFLDEVGDMSLSTQAKLLRVLEDRKVERLGGSQAIPVDVRVVSATNVNLEKAVEEGRFRADLYYRLRVVQVALPPLRDRLSDVPELALHFLRGFSEKYGLACRSITPSAMAALASYAWPGNVRELRNAVERAAALAAGDSITSDDLSFSTKPRHHQDSSSSGDQLMIPFDDDFREARRSFERAYIERCLIETGGNVTRAAEKIGMHRQSLQQKLKDLGMSRKFVTALDDEED